MVTSVSMVTTPGTVIGVVVVLSETSIVAVAMAGKRT